MLVAGVVLIWPLMAAVALPVSALFGLFLDGNGNDSTGSDGCTAADRRYYADRFQRNS